MDIQKELDSHVNFIVHVHLIAHILKSLSMRSFATANSNI